MVNTEPNPIKEYYIAYFDILGFKDFFKQQPEKVPELLNSIHNAIQHTKEYISQANNSLVLKNISNIKIYTKVFSDNILLCMESLSIDLEQLRLLMFLWIIADIQRGFINDYSLFVRGGILKGELSFHDDYVFGKGLIDIVAMEENAQYPRIIISKDLIDFLQNNPFYIQKDISRAIEIGNRLINKDAVNDEEKSFFSRMVYYAQRWSLIERERAFLTFYWPDENWILSYLYKIDASTLYSEDEKNKIVEFLQKVSPYDYELFSQSSWNFDENLHLHKIKVEEKLKKFGRNWDISVEDTKEAEFREKILRKYIWVMAFHNCICDLYNKPEHKIATQCNCDPRFLKMVIEVL